MIYYLKHNIHKLNWTIIGNVLGMVLIAQACLMVLPVMVDLIYQEGLFDSYLIVIGICLVLGYGLTRKKARTNSYFAKDGMAGYPSSFHFKRVTLALFKENGSS